MAAGTASPDATPTTPGPAKRRDRTHWLYIAVIVAVLPQVRRKRQEVFVEDD